jgi:hypothetical protein
LESESGWQLKDSTARIALLGFALSVGKKTAFSFPFIELGVNMQTVGEALKSVVETKMSTNTMLLMMKAKPKQN